MKTRTLAVAGLTLTAGFAANAAMIVNTETTDAGTRSDVANFENGESMHLVQRVNFDGSFDLENIQINAMGTDFNLYLSREIGLAADDSDDILWSATGISSEGGSFEWMSFDATGVNVGAGEYYLIMTSADEDGGRWREVLRTAEGTLGIGNRGDYSFIKDGDDSIVAHDYSSSTSRWVYGARINGELGVPAPGSAALFGLAGLTAARRRR